MNRADVNLRVEKCFGKSWVPVVCMLKLEGGAAVGGFGAGSWIDEMF